MRVCDRLSRVSRIALLLTWVVLRPAQAPATVDLTGHWDVHTTTTIDIFGSPVQFTDDGTWDFVQNGSTLTLTGCSNPLGANIPCPDTGAIDLMTGTATLPAPPPCTVAQCLAACPVEACQFDVTACPFALDCFLRSVCDHTAPTVIIATANGQLFSGTSDYATLLDPMLHCGSVHVDIMGSHCNHNGIVDPGEECDDGNTVDGDGCDSNCTVTRCGNGIVTAGEQCDDGNTDSNDACKNDCTLNVCGDGVLRTGVEECDDGNLVDGDGCSAQCKREFIAGGGDPSTDCLHEWVSVPVAPAGPNGLRRNRLICTDDDPSCDFGAASGDQACTFHIGMCFNVADPLLACAATGVRTVAVLHPASWRNDSVDVTNRTGLENALAGIGGRIQGICTNRGASTQRQCATNSDCDTAPGSGNGRCARLVAFGNPLSAPVCSNLVNITVPLRGAKRAQTLLRLRSASASGLRDSDALTLVCKRAP
jgi:cysteine-rich repeat protein